MIAEQDKIQQKIAYEGAVLEAKKIKELADAEAYSKARVMQADGALDKKLNAYIEVQKSWPVFSLRTRDKLLLLT